MVHARTCDSSSCTRPIQPMAAKPSVAKPPEPRFKYRVRWEEMENNQ